MRAAVLEAPRRVVLRELPPPEPARGEVRVRVRGAGICGSELPLWQGREWFDYPREAGEPGHEGWGTVEALGDDVSELAVGQRVTFISQRAHAEYDLTRAAHAVALPGAVADPFPGEPLACAVNALRRAGIEAGQRVAVVGCGFLGLLLVALAAAEGADVVAISQRATSLEHAAGMGARQTWRLPEGGQAGEAAYDVVIEATGHQEPLDLAARLTRVRGRLVIAGYHQDGLRTVDMQLWNWRGLDVVNAHERDPDVYATGLREAVGIVAAGRLDLAPLLTHQYALDELGEAYGVCIERPPGFVKAVWRDG